MNSKTNSCVRQTSESDQDQDQEQDQERDNAESRRHELIWTTREPKPAESGPKPIWGELDGAGWRRNKRDIENRIRLASSRSNSRTRSNVASAPDDESFAIDDGDEDAWVHDGIDDIHIDPETKRAASEVSSSVDDSSIDSEYEPKEQQLVNRTRVTTISEVIPIAAPEGAAGADDSGDSTSLSSRYMRPAASVSGYLPAALLTLDQARRLVETNQPPPGESKKTRPTAAALELW